MLRLAQQCWKHRINALIVYGVKIPEKGRTPRRWGWAGKKNQQKKPTKKQLRKIIKKKVWLSHNIGNGIVLPEQGFFLTK